MEGRASLRPAPRWRLALLTAGVQTAQVRELLSLHDFPGDDIPFVRGSALCALEVRNTAACRPPHPPPPTTRYCALRAARTPLARSESWS